MSSFTSGASLRRRCLVLSSEKENIISAHGPFLDSINVSEWEAHNHQPVEPAVRVKVFADLGAYVDTVLPLGATGHVVAVSNILRDKLNDEYRVYATLVSGDDITFGGYALSNRFVISSQPLSEQPHQPKVAVVLESNKFLVLTGSCLKVFEYSYNTVDGTTAFTLPHIRTIDYRTEWRDRIATDQIMRPLFLAPIEPFEFVLLNHEEHLIISNYGRRVCEILKEQFRHDTPISAAYFLHDMQFALIADHNELHVVRTEIGMMQSAAPGDSFILKNLAIIPTDGPVTQIAVSDDGVQKRMVATVERTQIRLWTLTQKSFKAYGSIDCSANPATRCLLFNRSTSTEAAPADPQSVLSEQNVCGDALNVQALRVQAVNLYKEHKCTAVIKDGVVVKPCMLGVCTPERLDHLVKCGLNEACTDRFCMTFNATLLVDGKPETCTHKMRTLIAIAYETGDVKVLDTAAYRTLTMEQLPTQLNDVVTPDIISFCPVWKSWWEAGQLASLKGIYAVTAQGEHVYRSFDGPKSQSVVTTVLAKDMMGQSSFVAPGTGAAMVIAYGRASIKISAHLPGATIAFAPSLQISMSTPIIRCFAHITHIFICTETRIVLLSTISFTKPAVMTGVATGGFESKELGRISAYGSVHAIDVLEGDLQLSIVGTMDGRIYSMKLKKGEMYANHYDNLQALIDAPSTNQFIFQESLSTPFITSGNEEIVSTVTRFCNGVEEMIVMGLLGSVVRFTYARGKGVSVLEMVTAGLASPPSPLTYRTLTLLNEANKPLIVAHKRLPLMSGRSMEIQLLNFDTREPLFTVDLELNGNEKVLRSDNLFVYGQPEREGGVAILALQKGGNTVTTTRNECGDTMKTVMDSFVRFEGTLKMTERNQLVQNALFPNEMQAVHIASFIHADGKRTASVIGVHGREVIESRMSNISKLRPRAKIVLSDKNVEYQHSCSSLLSTPNCSFLLIGCKSGEVLMVKMQRPEIPISSLDFTVLVKETIAIEKLSIFSESSTDVTKERLLFTVMTVEAVSVYSLSLNEGTETIEQLKSWKINMKGPSSNHTLLSIGSLHSSHNIWLTSKEELIVWRGREGTFKEEITRSPLSLDGSISVATSFTIRNTNKNGVTPPPDFDYCGLSDLLCVGTNSGAIRWFYSEFGEDEKKEMKGFDLNSVGSAVKGLACQVFEYMNFVDPTTLQFGVRVYILTDRRVIVNTMRVNVTTRGMKIRQITQHNLYHFVRDPSQFAIEKSVITGVNKKTKKRKDLPQRLIVTGGEGYEVVLLCPKKMNFKEPPLSVGPLVGRTTAVNGESIHVMRNNTDRVMHVSVKRTSESSVLNVNGTEWKLEKKCEATMRIVRNEEEKKEGEDTVYQFVIEWKMEKDEKNEEQKGEVVLFVNAK